MSFPVEYAVVTVSPTRLVRAMNGVPYLPTSKAPMAPYRPVSAPTLTRKGMCRSAWRGALTVMYASSMPSCAVGS